MPRATDKWPFGRHPALYWLALAGYTAILFIQSSLPSPDLGSDLPGQDKVLHLAAYTLMGYLACCAFATLRILRTIGLVCLAGVLFSVLFGLGDEWHQTFVPGRHADGWDLAADSLGALLGAAVFAWRHRPAADGDRAFPR